MEISICPPRVPQPPAETLQCFPFLKLSAEIRNQIYLDVIGPEVPRPQRLEQCPRRSSFKVLVETLSFWPDRKFNTAFFVLNRQIHQEFFHTLWKVLSVEWKLDNFDLDLKELALFTSMERLRRCKLILTSRLHFSSECKARPLVRSRYGDATAYELDVELTVFGLAHKLNRMPHPDEIDLEYDESMYGDDYFVRYRDGSLVRFDGSDLKTSFGTELRGMKKIQISGNLCDECSSLLASAMKRPKEALPEAYRLEPEKCIPRETLPQWNDKARVWI
ncbi:MAG: hypothetical protein LQ343_005014 [Gyalolechia ehrenbergii]|nr:MAG: hypothetical protein LQ343_005014 [Gyalolechia ehrenbergii]